MAYFSSYQELRNFLEKKLGKISMSQLITTNALNNPDKTAIIAEDGIFTYKELAETTNRLASSLKKLGVKKGDKIATIFWNGAGFVHTYFAVAKAGAVNVALNYRLAGKELEYIINHCDAKVLLIDEEYYPVISDIRANLLNIKEIIIRKNQEKNETSANIISFQQLIDEGSPEPLEIMAAENDDVAYIYTSGTIGIPKGVMLTHNNCLAQIGQAYDRGEFKETDLLITAAPAWHAQTYCNHFACLLAGGTAIFVKAFEPLAMLKRIEDTRATIHFGVPAMYIAMLNHPQIGSFKLNSLRKLIYGGAVMPAEIVRRLKETFPQLEGVQDFYGMTETAGVVLTWPYTLEEAIRKAGAQGKPVLGDEVLVCDDQGKEVPVGEVGEFVIKGPALYRGYYKDEVQTADAIRGGWFYSGDLGKKDEEGFYYVIDRKKDMINRGGENVYPAEIENVLLKHQVVADVAVLGYPDERLGERTRACIVVKEGLNLTESEVREHCKKYLAVYKVPDKVEFCNVLPRSAAGKLLKRVLREDYNKSVFCSSGGSRRGSPKKQEMSE
jgi:long-chain acyl-CoA synthetase